MEGLITGTIFVSVWLLVIKIGERIDASRTRRRQEWLDSLLPRYGPTYPSKVEMIPLPPQEMKERKVFGVTMEEAQQAFIALGKATSAPLIDVTLKDDPKPPYSPNCADQ